MSLKRNLEDCTKEELIEQVKKLQNKIELEEKFLLNISHDLRSPINVILSILQSLKYVDKREDSKEKILEYRKVIRRNSFKMMKLVDNLIDTTKIEEKYYNLNKQAIDIVSLIENTVVSIDKYAKEKNIELIFDTNVEEAIVLVDPEAIDRVIVNLVSNAIKFSPKSSTVLIYLLIDKDSIKIIVKDQGIGISNKDKDNIFNRFIQAQKNKQSENEGSGIGLDLVNNLVKLHGGNIVVDSEVGKGSEFVVTLPKISASIDQKSYRALSYDKVQQLEMEFSDIYL